MGQMVLLPMDLEDEIEPNHLVRVVHAAVEKMDLSKVYEQYAGGGTSSYHPKMLLKVLIYAYSQQIFSSRKIAKALRENIYFMWLSGNSHPDFHTVNRFRGEVVKESITEIFTAVLLLLVEGGYVKLENYFVDGTKIKSKASKYSFVWAKNTQRYKEQVQAKVRQLLERVDQLNTAEDAELGESDLPERGNSQPLDAARLEAKILELNERLRQLAPREGGSEPLVKAVSPAPQPNEAGVMASESERLAASDPISEPAKEQKEKKPKTKAQQLSQAI